MLLDKIDITLLQKETFNLKTHAEYIKKEFENTGLLLKGPLPKCNYKPSGLFEDETWVIMNKLNYTYIYFLFGRLNGLKFKRVTKTDELLIKCWIAENILKIKYTKDDDFEYGNVSNMHKQYNALINFIDASSNFAKDFLNSEKGSHIQSYFSSSNGLFDLCTVISYINYIEDKISVDKLAILYEYKNSIEDIISTTKNIQRPRKLPNTKNIFLFSSYINKFFYEDEMSKELKLYYFPILLWWKITTVIPMRPSEFCIGIKRNALITLDDDYYLKINRIKEKTTRRNKPLPTLKKIKITKDLYDLITYYIDSTEPYGKTQTLISYPAAFSIRNILAEIHPQFKPCLQTLNKSNKVNIEFFTCKNLDAMLNSFYKKIIKDMYCDSLIDEQILPGDTRHIAFTSLVLQGYSPVEIAIMGGHKSLNALDNYTCSPNTYIDSEVLNIITKSTNIKSSAAFAILDAFEKMSPTCPTQKGMPSYVDNVQIGICTANFMENPFPCESNMCYKCSKWWCEPTESNYWLLENVIKSKITNTNKRLEENIHFILSLFKNLGLEVQNGHLVAELSTAKEIKKMTLQINSDAENIIRLKSEISLRNISTIKDVFDIQSVDKNTIVEGGANGKKENTN